VVLGGVGKVGIGGSWLSREGLVEKAPFDGNGRRKEKVGTW
jgi:hypothetical protein